MYSLPETRALQKTTDELLKAVTSGKLSEKKLKELKEVLRYHEYRYYILADPHVSDFEYDQLYKALETIEKEKPELTTKDSPTQRVAVGLTSHFPKVEHLVPMLSLENSYDADDLVDWDRKAREAAGLPSIEYCVEPKFDGASISLLYENDVLVRGATRGDGVTGDEITPNIRQVRAIPLSAKFSDYGLQLVEIRGEVLMNKNNFKKYNLQLAEQNLPPLANPRNAAAGSLRIKDPNEVKRRNLEAFLYNISFYQPDLKKLPVPLQTHGGTLEMLWKLGFRSPEKEKKVVSGIEAVIAWCEAFEKKRDDLPYEIDGMVIKVNDVALQDRLGMTTHHPRWAIAFKFKARQGTSKLKTVEFQVGRTGSITPVAKIDPVPIGGVMVGSISLFNEDVIREKDLRIGDTVLVERAGDVIPYIVKPMVDLRTGNEKKILFPSQCPVCKDELYKLPDEAAWRCNNINCEAQVLERMFHFTSKDAMDIRGFGEANIRKFYELKLLTTIPGIYKLPYDTIGSLEGFGKKSIENLQASVEKSKEQPLHRLLYALGIRYVGETTAKTLARSVKHALDFRKFSIEELQELEDIGPKVAGSIFQFFQNDDNIQMLKELEAAGVHLEKKKEERPASLSILNGQTFLFTGSLPTLKRTDAEEMVELHGGKLLGSVSSKLNFLVVGEDAGSKLEKAKKIGSIRIISEAEFMAMIGKN